MTEIRIVDDGYRPGACNIGPAEIRRRQLAVIPAVLGTLVVAAALLALRVDPIVRLLLIAPLAGTATTVYQATQRFCIGFGMAGLQNFGALGGQSRVADDAARRADRAKALRAIVLSGIVATVLGVLFALLPV